MYCQQCNTFQSRLTHDEGWLRKLARKAACAIPPIPARITKDLAKAKEDVAKSKETLEAHLLEHKED